MKKTLLKILIPILLLLAILLTGCSPYEIKTIAIYEGKLVAIGEIFFSNGWGNKELYGTALYFENGEIARVSDKIKLDVGNYYYIEVGKFSHPLTSRSGNAYIDGEIIHLKVLRE